MFGHETVINIFCVFKKKIIYKIKTSSDLKWCIIKVMNNNARWKKTLKSFTKFLFKINTFLYTYTQNHYTHYLPSDSCILTFFLRRWTRLMTSLATPCSNMDWSGATSSNTKIWRKERTETFTLLTPVRLFFFHNLFNSVSLTSVGVTGYMVTRSQTDCPNTTSIRTMWVSACPWHYKYSREVCDFYPSTIQISYCACIKYATLITFCASVKDTTQISFCA